MSEQQSSYRQIMKATSLFGGVQIFNIIISIIRSKFIAILLGPEGMGIMGLLTSTIAIISRLSNFGLETSAVKDISTAFGTGNAKRIEIVIAIIRKLVWITGLIGVIITSIFSTWLSQITFGNNDYKLAFIWLSITLLFNQLTSGQLVILQGLRKLNYLAKANLSGSLIGIFISIPLYYIWGLDGIVPAIICTALFSLLISWYYSSKIKFKKTIITTSQTLTEGRNMLMIGLLISLSGFFSVFTSHIVRIFISRTGGVEQVGLFNAGFTIINTYVGLIFTAMATDYYPRLSAKSDDNNICKQTINQQSEIAILILAPILIVFLVFINWVVILLYSRQFLAVCDMIYWASLGMFFKTSGWAIAFLFLAKGEGKIYFFSETSSNLYKLIFNIIGYNLAGLSGLGISFTSYYLIYVIQVYLISRNKFSFTFNHSYIKIFAIQFSLAIAGFLTVKLSSTPYKYIIGIFIIVISIMYSILELDKRLKIKIILNNLIKKYKTNLLIKF